MDCEKRDQAVTVAYIVYEGAQARAERTHKRLIIVIVILCVMLFACNMAWLYAFSQYDYESYQYEQDGEGVNIIGDHNSEVYNGTESADTQADKSGQQGQSDAKEA